MWPAACADPQAVSMSFSSPPPLFCATQTSVRRKRKLSFFYQSFNYCKSSLRSLWKCRCSGTAGSGKQAFWRAGSRPHAATLTLLLQGFLPWAFKCIFVSVSSVWTRHGCEQKRFNWFGSASCWDRRSLLKHAWHTEIIRAYYHIKGGVGATALFPFMLKQLASLMTWHILLEIRKMNLCTCPDSVVVGGRSNNHSGSFMTQRRGWFMCCGY